jgi:hypothetical protein
MQPVPASHHFCKGHNPKNGLLPTWPLHTRDVINCLHVSNFPTAIHTLESPRAMTITELKPYEDKTVILHLRDGEVATAKIALVDAEYEDVIVDIVETNRPDAYRKPIGSSAFAIRLSDLDFIEEISN